MKRKRAIQAFRFFSLQLLLSLSFTHTDIYTLNCIYQCIYNPGQCAFLSLSPPLSSDLPKIPGLGGLWNAPIWRGTLVSFIFISYFIWLVCGRAQIQHQGFLKTKMYHGQRRQEPRCCGCCQRRRSEPADDYSVCSDRHRISL